MGFLNVIRDIAYIIFCLFTIAFLAILKAFLEAVIGPFGPLLFGILVIVAVATAIYIYEELR